MRQLNQNKSHKQFFFLISCIGEQFIHNKSMFYATIYTFQERFCVLESKRLLHSKYEEILLESIWWKMKVSWLQQNVLL